MRRTNAAGRDHRGQHLRNIRRRPDMVAAVVVTVLATLMGGVALSTAREHHWQSSGIALGVGTGVFGWLSWNILVRSRVGVWANGLDVINGFVYHWLPWSSIAVADSAVDVVLRLTDGKRIRPLSLLGSPAGAIIFGGRHQHGVTAALEAERGNRASADGGPRVRRYQLRLMSLLVIAAIVVALGFAPTS